MDISLPQHVAVVEYVAAAVDQGLSQYVPGLGV